MLEELQAERTDMLNMVAAGLDPALIATLKTGLARMKANVSADLRTKSLERDLA